MQLAGTIAYRPLWALQVGVDASTWLHRGAYGCARELALGKQCDSYVRYALRRMALLIPSPLLGWKFVV